VSLRQLTLGAAASLWTGTDNTSGARCLIAWENVCQAKEDGGLGIKRIDTQNACLLLKLLHRVSLNPVHDHEHDVI
jgi:hypothetical protein